MTEMPPPRPRPRFAQWMYDRRLSARDVSKALECSHEQVRRVCLPYDDKDHRRASQRLRQKVAHLTAGEIGLDDWEHEPARPYAAERRAGS